MAAPLRIALAGLGTVGGGVIRLIETNGPLIERRAGRPIVITAVSARDRNKDRGVDISRYGWEDDMTAMAARDDVDAVVELVGGAAVGRVVLGTRRRARQPAAARHARLVSARLLPAGRAASRRQFVGKRGEPGPGRCRLPHGHRRHGRLHADAGISLPPCVRAV